MATFSVLAVLSLLTVATVAAQPDSAHFLENEDTYSVDQNGKLVKGREPEALAWARYADQVDHVGWGFLEVHTHRTANDSISSHAAGLLEGYLTARRIGQHFGNTVGWKFKLDTRVAHFLQQNLEWMDEQIKANPTDDYWLQVDLSLRQLRGVTEGAAMSPDAKDFPRPLSFFDLYILNSGGDTDDIASAVNATQGRAPPGLAQDRCSALVKLLPHNASLLISQDAWDGLTSMLRVYKWYDLGYRTAAGAEVATGAMSSYPGIILSSDDFYTLSSGLAVVETTMEVYNNELYYAYVRSNGTVLEWLRNIVANRLATSAPDWTQLFGRYNSGTCNNQWLVVDYNKFTPHRPVLADTLWLLEQIPGTIESRDMSHALADQRYWPSYNTPYFQDVFQKSGTGAQAKAHGSWFTYNATPRALIFHRDQDKVTDISTMKHMMRYNNFRHDPLSACACDPPYSGENGISSRCDLNPRNGTYPFATLGHRCTAGYDSKITSDTLIAQLASHAISGPTYDELPVFEWSKADLTEDECGGPHDGHPDKFDFDWVQVRWPGL